MAKARSELSWQEIDPSTLPEAIRNHYEDYKAAYRTMKELRGMFEEALNAAADLPEGKRIVCGYNFGKLSIALADDDRKPAKSQAKGSLADFLAQSQTAGRRV